MAPDDSGQTIGIWIGEDDDLIERFDRELAADDPASYSRSKAIKDSMRFYLEINRTLEQLDFDFPSEREKRAWLRQAILDAARAEEGH